MTMASLDPSGESFQEMDLAFALRNEEKCRRFTKMAKAGKIMTFVGGGVGIAGTALFITSLVRVFELDSSEEEFVFGYVGGVVGMGLGYTTMAGGIALWAIGGKKAKQYCGNGKSGLLLEPQGNKVALVYRF